MFQVVHKPPRGFKPEDTDKYDMRGEADVHGEWRLNGKHLQRMMFEQNCGLMVGLLRSLGMAWCNGSLCIGVMEGKVTLGGIVYAWDRASQVAIATTFARIEDCAAMLARHEKATAKFQCEITHTWA